ncbi:MAG: hypothetical protein IID16_09090 [Candidatus Marinimicrobia bacterium]|nr:hypothetical protein [Candidatus Neomarinimicrobiota bacterium]
MWINHHSLPAGRQAYSNHNMSIDGYYFQSILPDPPAACPPAGVSGGGRTGGLGDVSQNITYIYTIRRPF